MCADNPKQGIWQKLKSFKVPLLYVLIGAPIFLIIVCAIYAITALTGKDPAFLAISTGAECKDDWFLYRGKCYYTSDRPDTWTDSQNFCKSHNSSLAIIDNEREMNFLNLLNSNNYWIGLSRTQDDSGWVWTNGTFYSGTLFNITRKPTASNETEHVYLNGKGFHSHSGRYAIKYICSKSVRSSS
ncbi:C-type lectin domain family 2 member D2-like [Rana temporaria]|uniref:C-type lectin domain family 2 member D2-like n=1 Tax=Rana temporaria TaxID=8407 RepID=UPI001AACA058|nr:C-type lectin domain family 2 member D2-like [Rana temporaria]